MSLFSLIETECCGFVLICMRDGCFFFLVSKLRQRHAKNCTRLALSDICMSSVMTFTTHIVGGCKCLYNRHSPFHSNGATYMDAVVSTLGVIDYCAVSVCSLSVQSLVFVACKSAVPESHALCITALLLRRAILPASQTLVLSS